MADQSSLPETDGDLFMWLVAPLTLKTFHEEFWEKKPITISRNNENYYSHVLPLTTQRLDAIFREFPLFYTENVDVAIYKNGFEQVHNRNGELEGRALVSRLYTHYINGCSLRVLDPQSYDEKVHFLLATLQEYFGATVGANLILTPPASQGFAPHNHNFDSFVLQLEGRKHFKLYKASGKDVLARDPSNNLKRGNIGEPFMEITLKTGDLLYFPRGTIHEGRTDADSHSLHLSVSVYQRTSYADLLEAGLPLALKKAARKSLAYRKGLPLDYLRFAGCGNKDRLSDVRSVLVVTVKKLLVQLKDHLDVDGAVDLMGKRFVSGSMRPALSPFEKGRTLNFDGEVLKDGKVSNWVWLNRPDNEFRLLRYHCLRLVKEEEGCGSDGKRGVKVYYSTDNGLVCGGKEGRCFGIEGDSVDCVRMLQNNYPDFVKVKDLAACTSYGFVSDLWERGLLVASGKLPLAANDEEGEEKEKEEEGASGGCE